MKAKILKTEAEYTAALDYIERLMDAEPGSSAEEELELFSLLVEQYEQERYPIAPPDPIDAILFRMEQQGLVRKDLAPYIGSQSRISEVLNRKRPLSLQMIRRLHEGLGIPASSLLQESGAKLESLPFNPQDFPLTAMFKAGYFEGWSGTARAVKEYSEELLTPLLSVFHGLIPQAIYCRRTDNDLDVHALTAWQARLLQLIQEEELPAYAPDALDEAFFKRLVRASYFPEGPTLVQRMLNEKGIHFALLPHLPKTYLDGAAFLSPQRHPVIGLTLRHDRMHNFWFTLAHELAHIHLHLLNSGEAFFDDMEHRPCATDDPREEEANAFAQEMFIAEAAWQAEALSLLASCEDGDILALAEKLEISPAVVAGRIRWESGDYTRCTRLIGQGGVREIFPEF